MKKKKDKLSPRDRSIYHSFMKGVCLDCLGLITGLSSKTIQQIIREAGKPS